MKRKSEHHPIFEIADSRLLLQSGSTSAFSVEDSTSYVAIKARAVELRNLFEKHNLSPQKSSTLTKLINDAVELSDAWLCNTMDQISFNHLLSAFQIDRIAMAALPIGAHNDAKAVLSSLLKGSINLLDREQSKAKDTLWELELLGILTSHGIDARLGEPDIIVTFEGTRVGIACKKFYSELNVSKVLSQAVAQIERDLDFGIVALNIDDTLPANVLLKAATVEDMAGSLTDRNYDFLRNHERHLKRYLTPGRALSALVSCSSIADVTSAKQRFMNARQSTVWHVPGLSQAKDQQMKYFFEAINSQY